ncbi:MAG TPA: ATP-binding protein [Oligoflexus sp.]|uniref:sensor histidine kinase n=1 Tax=Oligoflexus sp. TaxID=1971216 RepID=UPI002D7F34A5|nr:ATP-binding protein [Oligoflexus sp.]HET9240953.1 ATP-binding protein [Oligoflexus sp.]
MSLTNWGRRFIRLLDYFIHPPLKMDGMIQRLRARVLVGTTLYYLLHGIGVCLFMVFVEKRSVGWILLTLHLCVSGAILSALQRSSYLRLIAVLLTLSILVMTTLRQTMQASIFAPFYFWIPTLLVYTTFISGPMFGVLLVFLLWIQVQVSISINAGHGYSLGGHKSFDDLFLSLLIGLNLSQWVVSGISWAFDLVRERSDRQLEEEMRKNSKAARSSAVSEMVGSFAHEVNNPLAIIQAGLYRLGKVDSDQKFFGEAQLKTFQNMEKALDRVLYATESLKAFVGHNDQEPLTRVTARDLLRQLLIMTQSEITFGQLELKLSDNTGLVSFPCRPLQIIHVLRSLVANSIEALAGRRDGVIHVEALLNGEQTAVQFRVMDNGPGVAPEIEDKLFQPFVTTKTSGEAQGLGLCLCRAIAGEHRGSLEYQPEKGPACFTLQLPLMP